MRFTPIVVVLSPSTLMALTRWLMLISGYGVLENWRAVTRAPSGGMQQKKTDDPSRKTSSFGNNLNVLERTFCSPEKVHLDWGMNWNEIITIKTFASSCDFNKPILSGTPWIYIMDPWGSSDPTRRTWALVDNLHFWMIFLNNEHQFFLSECNHFILFKIPHSLPRILNHHMASRWPQ